MAAGERTLILAEGFSADTHYGKTMRGVLRYRRERRRRDPRLDARGESEDGRPDRRRRRRGARVRRPTVALVGVATQGGRFPPAWRESCAAASTAGSRSRTACTSCSPTTPSCAPLADAAGVELRDLRRPPTGLDCANGREPRGRRPDRAHRRLRLRDREDDRLARARPCRPRERGLASVFVPTGQTGIAIAGWGISVDAVVADFLSGAAERLVVEGRRRGGELLFVEGQGSLVHPAYSGVTLGLYHGSVPHALVLCHRAGATEIEGYPGHPIPPLRELVALHERISLPRRRARVVALALEHRRARRLDRRAGRSPRRPRPRVFLPPTRCVDGAEAAPRRRARRDFVIR